jgi:transcription antitermination factor NusG
MRCDYKDLDKRWLCAQVRSGSEFRTASGLNERGYESFVPVFEQKRRWSDRFKIVESPLFSGYVFLRFNAASVYPAVTTPGILRLVGTDRMPATVEDSEIEALQFMTQTGLLCGPCAFLEVGHEVEVRLGPLASLRGKIVRFKNKQRLVLSVNLIRQSVFVEVDGYEITPVLPAFSPGNRARALDANDGIVAVH